MSTLPDPLEPPLTPAEQDVEAAVLAYDADPTPEHEVQLRAALRAGGASSDEADRFVRSLSVRR